MVGRCIHPLYHDEIKERMKVPCVLSDAQMKCMVWGYDAINFIHKHRAFSSTPALHLLVSESDIQSCAEAIVTSLPNFQNYRGFKTFPWLLETMFTGDEPVALSLWVNAPEFLDQYYSIPSLNSTLTSKIIIVLSLSGIFLTTSESQRSLRSSTPWSRYTPILLLATITGLLVNWEFDLLEGALGSGSQLLKNGRLRPACSRIKESLRLENRPYLEAMALGRRLDPLLETRPHRRSLLSVKRGRDIDGSDPQPSLHPQVPKSSEGASNTSVSTPSGKRVFPTTGEARRPF